MSAQHLGALFWSQWAARDLPWLRRLQGAWHLRRCAHCRGAAQRLRQEQEVYTQSDDFAAGLQMLRRHLPNALQRRRPIRTALAWAGGLAAAVLAVLHPLQTTPSLRAKGAASVFALYVQRDDTVSPLGATCRAHDALRARYESPLPYLMVVEVDGDGDAQVAFPNGGTASARIALGRHFTPGSWVLDASSDQERFIALFSEAPLTFSQARACIDAPTACDKRVVRLEVACRKE